MKNLKLTTVFIGCVVITSCQNDSVKKERVIADSSATCSCEIYKGDTCNRKDWRGKKQGKWYLFDKRNHEITDTIYYKDGVELDKSK